MKYMSEDLRRLLITAAITTLFIAAFAWYEYRTGFLESLIEPAPANLEETGGESPAATEIPPSPPTP